jgi:RHS repeat-associated protein
LLLRNYIKHFKFPALQQAVSYKHLHNQVEQCGLEKRTRDTVVQSAVIVAVCRNAAKRERTTTRKEVTRSYYDKTNTSILAQLPNSFTPDPLTQRKRIVHVTYEAVYDSNDATYNHATHYDYDIHGNVKTLLQDNADLGALNQLASQRFKRMDYTFDLISGNVHRVDYETNKADQWHHAYSYDADNRITAVYTTSATPLVNDPLAMSSLQNEPLLNPTWEKEAAYSYYAHGPLARTVIGEQEVQGLDYVYTLQGWIKGVNSNNLDANNDPGKDGLGLSANHRVAQDVMSYSLHYFNNDYLPIVNGNTTYIADQSNSDMLQNSSDLYNGNIARMVTTITDPNSRAVLPLGNAYQYDQLNRLKHAVSFDQLNGNAWAGGAPAKYENSFTYDANGNILTQTRNDDNNQVIDELAYFYPKNAANNTVRNRLLYVSDNVDYDALDIDPGMSASNYAYDEEGRLIQDLQEGIEEINWRVDGKVKRINRIANSTKQNLSFDYDAMGHRIAKHVYTSANVLEKSTYYVLDASGNTMATYERAVDENTLQISYAQTEKFIYGSSRLGVQNCNIALLGSQNNTYTQTTVAHRIGKKGYELSNHLGSVITVVSDKVIPHSNGSTVDYWLADILQSTDYSPFGVLLSNRTLSKSGVTDFVRFGYQGSEMDNELKDGGNSYTTEYRQLDPRLGRWFSSDPVFQPHQSPYNSMDNNPIMLNDIFGLKGEGWGGKKKEDGGTKWEYDDEITLENYKDKGFTTYMDEGVIYGENLATEVKSNYELLKNGEYLDLNLYDQNEVIIFPKSNEENQNSPTNNNSNLNSITSTLTNTTDIVLQVVGYVSDDASNVKTNYIPKVPDNPNAYKSISKFTKKLGIIATAIDVFTNYADASINFQNGKTSEGFESLAKGTASIGVSVGSALASGAAIGAWGGPAGLVVGIGISVSWMYISNLNWW